MEKPAGERMSQPPMGNGIDDRKTPHDLFDRLNDEHHFTLDAAASHQNALCDLYCTLFGTWSKSPFERVAPGDGLRFPWFERIVFFNPPYGRGLLAPFVEKAWNETKHGWCPEAVGLLPVRTEQPWFHRYVFDRERRCWRPGIEVEFIEKRVKYDGLETGAPFPSMLVTWRKL